SELTLSGVISGGVIDQLDVGLGKQGTGTLVLTGANTFTTGRVVVFGGVLSLQNSSALGTTSLLEVDSGAALELQGGIDVTMGELFLSGTGSLDGPSALRSLGGVNSIEGPVFWERNAGIDVERGSRLRLNGRVGDGTFGQFDWVK